ncbi:hypothetical protein AVEN_265328-1 [Araneus ventricosus]|uniref:Uncharacterized protein n=1 Tax=Araneus ventricosus TaxID=182803 RepID=A0A4Y2MNR2_ARAVE|nr:hypothetical protein AVEN_265328-1 [Araneus ventricosus]
MAGRRSLGRDWPRLVMAVRTPTSVSDCCRDDRSPPEPGYQGRDVIKNESTDLHKTNSGRGGLVVRPRLRDKGSWVRNPISLQIIRVLDLLHAKSHAVAKHPPTGEVPAKRRPRHPTAVQSHEVRPKTALVYLQNGELISFSTQKCNFA